MNFFGHAIAASWKRRDPGFILGAMLPDLANIIGARTPTSTDPAVLQGLEFHVETDAVFHETSVFQDLQRQAREALAPTQLRRGTRLAVSHVGVEMLLDSYFSSDECGHAAYRDSLEAGSRDVADSISWRSTWEALRFRYLRHQMRTAAPQRRSPQPLEGMAARLEGALAARPSLRMLPGDYEVALGWLQHAEPLVFAAAPALVVELRAGLGLDTPPRGGSAGQQGERLSQAHRVRDRVWRDGENADYAQGRSS